MCTWSNTAYHCCYQNSVSGENSWCLLFVLINSCARRRRTLFKNIQVERRVQYNGIIMNRIILNLLAYVRKQFVESWGWARKFVFVKLFNVCKEKKVNKWQIQNFFFIFKKLMWILQIYGFILVKFLRLKTVFIFHTTGNTQDTGRFLISSAYLMHCLYEARTEY